LRLKTTLWLAGIFAGVALAADAAGAAPQERQINAPRMVLEAQYQGPMQDTLVQRWRDPANGAICYIYLPVVVQHSPPTPAGFVQYGPNGIGSISCIPPR
jgi:hypothetical protein